MDILIGFVTVIHLLVAALMVVLVLMQKSKDQGVGAAFGGGMTDTMFGAGTTSALVRMTIWCACIFLAGSLVLSVLHAKRNAGRSGSLMEKVIEGEPAGATAPALPGGEPGSVPAQPDVPLPGELPATTTAVSAPSVHVAVQLARLLGQAVPPGKVARAMRAEELHPDVRALLGRLRAAFGISDVEATLRRG